MDELTYFSRKLLISIGKVLDPPRKGERAGSPRTDAEEGLERENRRPQEKKPSAPEGRG